MASASPNRVDENLENPGTLRTEMLVASWGEYARTTKAETELAERAWSLHAGPNEPIVRRYIKVEPGVNSAWVRSVPQTE